MMETVEAWRQKAITRTQYLINPCDIICLPQACWGTRHTCEQYSILIGWAWALSNMSNAVILQMHFTKYPVPDLSYSYRNNGIMWSFGISNHWQFYCLFKLTTTKTSNTDISDPSCHPILNAPCWESRWYSPFISFDIIIYLILDWSCLYASVKEFILDDVICEHDDIIKWKHFPRYWPFVQGIHRSPVNSAHKGQWCGVLVFSLICAWINGWVNNHEAGDLRCHCTHYDVTVMLWCTRKDYCAVMTL